MSSPFERRPCGYQLCSALVMTRRVDSPPWGGPVTRHYPDHQIEHPLLSGTCPASLLPAPLKYDDPIPVDTVRLLNERATWDYGRIPELIEKQAKREEREIIGRTGPPPTSRSLRNPGRMGREPDPTSDDWVLGGREDEDVAAQKYAVQPPKIAKHIQGQEVGRHVASVHELLGMAQNAALQTGEAYAATQSAMNDIEAAVGKLEEAQATISALQGESESQTLRTYMFSVLEAKNALLECLVKAQESMIQIHEGQERGEQFMGILLS